VPHIYADTPQDLFTAWGYVLAQDRLWQLEVTRATVWGRVAELYGPGSDDEYVESDTLVRQGYSTAAEVWDKILSLPPESQALLHAFAEGIKLEIDEALADPAGKLPYEFHQFEVTPEPWT
jgi:penicillin amidase